MTEDLLRLSLTELEQCQRKVAGLREALEEAWVIFAPGEPGESFGMLVPSLRELGFDLCTAALSAPADDWLEQHDAKKDAQIAQSREALIETLSALDTDNYDHACICISCEAIRLVRAALDATTDNWRQRHDAEVKLEEQERLVGLVERMKLKHELSENNRIFNVSCKRIATAIREHEADEPVKFVRCRVCGEHGPASELYYSEGDCPFTEGCTGIDEDIVVICEQEEIE